MNPPLHSPDAVDEHADVLVVGGSLVGLSTALFLAWHGVRPVLVERRATMGEHPRAWGYNPRTMEMLAELGLAEAIDAAGPDTADYRDVLKVTTLAGSELGRYQPEHLQVAHRSFADISPAPYSLCAQHRLEPILRERAEQLGADIRFGTELVDLVPGPDRVRATVRGPDGVERVFGASYLVAADGLKSPIRHRLDIPTSGVRGMAHVMNVLFEADLSAALRNRTFFLCHVEKPPQAVLNCVDGINGTPQDRWQLHIPFDPHQGERPTDFGEERCRTAVRDAVGIPDLAVRIVQALPWEVAGYSAERFADGRVFLVGDAAHVMPPAGAFGANTGIHDAHNLAWKLAAVLRGDAEPALLDTYDAERRPVAEFTVEQALLRAVHQFLDDPGIADQIVDDRVIMFGIHYRSAAVPGGAVTAAPGEPACAGLRPIGVPGTRLPHLDLALGDRKLSSIDLIGPQLLLLAGPDAAGWARAAAATGDQHGVELRHRVLLDASVGGPADLIDIDDRFGAATGAGRDGAVLVRPDGIVAWRSAAAAGAESAAVLSEVIGRLLARSA